LKGSIVSQWLFPAKFRITIYALIGWVNTAHKTCRQVVMLGVRFLTALPLCVGALKLPKPPSYTG